jgi:hypothetical protein
MSQEGLPLPPGYRRYNLTKDSEIRAFLDLAASRKDAGHFIHAMNMVLSAHREEQKNPKPEPLQPRPDLQLPELPEGHGGIDTSRVLEPLEPWDEFELEEE